MTIYFDEEKTEMYIPPLKLINIYIMKKTE